MDDLISRQATLDHLRKRLIQTAYNNVGFVSDAGSTFEDASERVKTWLDEVPSIDAVKHGKWIAQLGGGYCCSECGSYSLDELDWSFVHVSARTRYCHNCGARMDGEQNG